jgi:hypothetical protein
MRHTVNDADIHVATQPRKIPGTGVREIINVAAERRLPKMHWRWCRRGREIVFLLEFRFGSVLPHDDAGMDAAALLAQHYMRLNIGAERVTRANLRLWAPWLKENELERLIRGAKQAETPSAARLGKQWRVTTDEVSTLGLTTIRAFTVTLESDRNRQDRRRRNAGAAKKRGRPSMKLSAEERRTRTNAQAAKRMKAKRARSSTGRPPGRPKNPLRENDHATSYIESIVRDEFSVTGFPGVAERPSATALQTPEVIEVADAELLPEIRITRQVQPDVIVLTVIPPVALKARRLPMRPGLVEAYQQHGSPCSGWRGDDTPNSN